MRVISLIKLMRPQFLIAGLFLNILGIAVATHAGASFDFARAVVFQIVIWSLQMVGAAANEYADVETDRINPNRTWFSGGSGMIVSGAVGRDVAMVLAILWSMVALILGVILSAAMGVTYAVPALVVLGMALALSYSLRPLRLVYRGLGELAMAFMVSVMIPVTSFLVQDPKFETEVLLVVVPLFFQMIGLMMVVQYPDFDADTKTGKRNLVVVLGRQASWRVSLLLFFMAAATAFYGGLFGLPPVFAFLAGIFLVMEALFFFIVESHLRSRTVVFWSTAIACGFYILVISILAVGFAI